MGDTIHRAFITSAAYKPKAFSSVHRHKVFKEGLSMEGLICEEDYNRRAKKALNQSRVVLIIMCFGFSGF